MQAVKHTKYSKDGVTILELQPGDDASDVPEELRAGLLAEGYLTEGEPKPEGKATRKALANKAIESASEDKAD